MTRIAVCQPSVPHYRGPVFNLLGSTPGVDLTVYAGSGGVAAWAAAIPEHFELRSGPIRRLPLLPGMLFQDAMLEAVKPGRHEIVFLPWDLHYLSLWPALDRARRAQLPVVLWGHGYSKHDNPLRARLRAHIGRRADAVMLYSHTIADRLIERYGFRRERVFVAQNALDQEPIRAAAAAWRCSAAALERFRAERGLDPAQTVIFVSRLEAANRCDLLIDALAPLLPQRPNLRLVVVGGGPERERLEVRARRAGVAKGVIFAGAIYDEQQLAPWMLSATLFCYPTNIGLSIQHAFGYGLPVVTGDDLRRHNPEIEALVPGTNGLLFRNGDVADLARQWERLISDRLLRERMGRDARRTVEERYTMQNMVRGFLEATAISRPARGADA